MTAAKYDLSIKQAETFDGTIQALDVETQLGRDLSIFTELRARLRFPGIDGTQVIALSNLAPTANGSELRIVAPSIAGPTAISAFNVASDAAASGQIVAPGAMFAETIVRAEFTENDDGSSTPAKPVLLTSPLVNLHDVATVAGAPTNDGDHVVCAVNDADTIEVVSAGGFTVEAPGGATVEVFRYGVIQFYITTADLGLLTFGADSNVRHVVGAYDLEGDYLNMLVTETDLLAYGAVELIRAVP